MLRGCAVRNERSTCGACAVLISLETIQGMIVPADWGTQGG